MTDRSIGAVLKPRGAFLLSMGPRALPRKCGAVRIALLPFSFFLGLAALVDRVAAQTEPPDNLTGKTVTIMPNPKAAGNPVTKITHFEHAWWDTGPFGVALNTPGQAAAFSGFGFDSVTFPNKRNQPDAVQNASVLPNPQGAFPKGVTPTPVTLASQIVVPNANGGAAQTFPFQAQVGTPDHATAKTSFTVSPYNADKVSFSIASSTAEYTNRNPLPGMSSYAFSYAGETYQNALATMKNGTVANDYTASVGRIGDTIPKRTLTIDPMSFQTYNSAGSPTLFNQFYDFVAGTTDNATFVADSLGYHLASATTDGEVDLAVHLDGTYLVDPNTGLSLPTGDLDVQLVNGLVTEEVATGYFSGVGFNYSLLNGVGSLDITNLPPQSFTFNIPDDGNPLNSVLFAFDEATLSYAGAVPAPPSFVLGGTAALTGLGYTLRRRTRKRLAV